MKKIVLSALILSILAFSCHAIGGGPSVRGIAMGGTGIATSNDISSVYYNPAGLMYGAENFELKAGYGGATSSLAGIVEAVSNADKFVVDNFDEDYSSSATLMVGLGASIKKVGLGAYATGNMNFKKPAKALSFSFDGSVTAYEPLTLGSTFATPGLPFASMSVGVNLKALQVGTIYTSVAQKGGSTGITGEGTSYYGLGTGFGFDIGAQARITPLIMVGAVIRNLSASANMTVRRATVTYEVQPDGSVDSRDYDTGDVKTTFTPPVEIGIGAGFIVPLTGTVIAVDVENYSIPKANDIKKSDSYSDTHIGIEQGVLFNMVLLRTGYYTYGPASDSFYTIGLGLNLGPANLDIAAANSVKDSKNSYAVTQIGMAF